MPENRQLSAGTGGNFSPERWQLSNGMGGNYTPEYALSDLSRKITYWFVMNMQFFQLFIDLQNVIDSISMLPSGSQSEVSYHIE
jgi:hypothetical protein